MDSELRLRPPRRLGKICINQLAALATCGIYGSERLAPQPISLDCELSYAVDDCILSDAVADAVNYADVLDCVHALLAGRSFALLETLVAHLCREVLCAFPRLLEVKFSVRKPRACHGIAPAVELAVRRSLVVLGLGSNLGDRLANLQTARDAIAAVPQIAPQLASSLHRTQPLLCEDQPEFLNQCLLVETILSPLELLAQTQMVERSLGRRDGQPKGPRMLDIDLLLFDGVACHGRQLSLPHPALRERRFWLEEMAELGIILPPASAAVWQQGCVPWTDGNW
ncbi:MAG: 2-amino-4-hydroxy-6-hydroxymethyldihydropteridine diphosphokinase [Puniceicoccales bacterium]|jgi:2-amino-4-hydroxy-6-hydroxymethyldihydropteridine diphosphokinase|nr:2-amino-4-hydroxy-6-hydroxymethyldihydropteridine diphosphokinase [Puniceicoccales bacterium]